MDATESAALKRLGERDEWPVHELPPEIDADILRCLDSDGLIEVCSVVLSHRRNEQSDARPAALQHALWFSPISQPEKVGGWDKIRSARPTEQEEQGRAGVTIKDVPMDDFGGFFPQRTQRIICVPASRQEPSFYVRVNEQGRARLTRMFRGMNHFNEMKSRRNLSEELRQFGIECALMISSDPTVFESAFCWLADLPICQAIAQEHDRFARPDDDRKPSLVVSIGGMPVNEKFAGPKFNVYDKEEEVNTIRGPILRRLMNAWQAATYRCLHQERGDDRYFDFGNDDALRIALLTALTFNKDFDGTVCGIKWSWEAPRDCDAIHEGRCWAWTYMTGGYVAEKDLIEVISVALQHLRQMPLLRKHENEHSITTTSGLNNGAAITEIKQTVQTLFADLLLFLKAQPDHRIAVEELPCQFLDPDLLTVMDADRLIRFGHQNHCHAGGKLILERGWDFVSVTGPHKNPMAVYIAECLNFRGDKRIREHVSLSDTGLVAASRLALAERTDTSANRRTNDTTTDGLAYATACREEAKKRGNGCKTWQIAKERGEDYLLNHPFPGQNELARRSRCNSHTMKTAIRESEILTRAKAAYDLARTSSSPRQERSEDPSWQAQVDEALRMLIESAPASERGNLNSPETRSHLESMEPDELAKLVEDARTRAKR